MRRALDQIQAVLSRIEDPYFRDRRSDVDMVGEYILRNLMGIEVSAHEAVPAGAVVFAHDLSPADITQLARVGVAGFFTEGGGKTSHSAVLARAYGLPYVVGRAGLLRTTSAPGMTVIVDGGRGEVILEPDEAALDALPGAGRAAGGARARGWRRREAQPAVTLDGQRVHLAANVELLEEVPSAVEFGAESIGLFRTEFLYLERAGSADRGRALRPRGGRPEGAGPGASSPSARWTWAATSCRPRCASRPGTTPPWACARSATRCGARTCSRRSCGRCTGRPRWRPLRILFPMISGVAELRAAKAICAEVCARAGRGEGRSTTPSCPLGVMIETPSAAVIADLLGNECEFLTIGTNDLIQYALAADRQDEHVGYLYHPLHPAILRFLRQVVLAAQRAGKPLAMCGDMAGDPLLTWVLLGLGLRDLSMAPRQIPIVKSIIRASSHRRGGTAVRNHCRLPHRGRDRGPGAPGHAGAVPPGARRGRRDRRPTALCG